MDTIEDIEAELDLLSVPVTIAIIWNKVLADGAVAEDFEILALADRLGLRIVESREEGDAHPSASAPPRRPSWAPEYGDARSPMRDDDPGSRGVAQGHRCSSCARLPHQTTGWRSGSIPLCWRLRRGCGAGNSTIGWHFRKEGGSDV
jgi:hypothetical protein